MYLWKQFLSLDPRQIALGRRRVIKAGLKLYWHIAIYTSKCWRDIWSYWTPENCWLCLAIPGLYDSITCDVQMLVWTPHQSSCQQHIEPLVSACYINCSVHLAVCDLNGFLDVDLDTKQKPCSASTYRKKFHNESEAVMLESFSASYFSIFHFYIYIVSVN